MSKRPRWPEIETVEHPLWVGKALNELLPALTFLVPLALLRWLDIGWLTATFALTVGAYVVLFDLLPWAVRQAREFMAGYREEPTRQPPGSDADRCSPSAPTFNDAATQTDRE